MTPLGQLRTVGRIAVFLAFLMVGWSMLLLLRRKRPELFEPRDAD